MSMNIYVGNLPYSVRDDELRATFEAYGKVLSAEVIFDKRTRRSRGYGFVEMADDNEARRAIAALNGKELHGRELRVDASQPKGEKQVTGAERPERRPAGGATEAPTPSPAPGGLKGFFKRLFG
jgi:RNA recognition motif-containing protein